MRKNCEQCGISFDGRGQRRFCSRQCYHLSRVMTIDKFMDKVVKLSSGCWEWVGYTDPTGYGKLGENGTIKLVHRYAYEQLVGSIPPNMCICHHCDNPKCVNPDHLFAGTHNDNLTDMCKKGRQGNQAGVANGNSKLDENQVAEIRRGLRLGQTQKSLALEFGVSRGAICNIATGKRWR